MMSANQALVATPTSFPLRLEAMETMEELFPKLIWKSRSVQLERWTMAAMEMSHSDLL